MTKTTMPICFEAIIFDWDATLANTQQAILFSFQQTLKKINLTIPDKHIKRCIGIGTAETFREILQQKTIKQQQQQPIDEELIKQLVESKSQIQISLKNKIHLFPGAIEILNTVKQNKIKIGLASMNNQSVINTLIYDKKIEKYFQSIVTAEDVTQSKPHPEIFLKCAQQLNTTPLKCIVIEDSLVGVKAAKTAGMHCIAITTGAYNKKELEQEKPNITVTNLKQAQTYLTKIIPTLNR
ncbi:MAG: HAD family phosphatase [Nitrososphaerota archaeon]|jgi:HAD superfamily hydrolase (TIGR01509 family)|nr:HAD family phosphatase [Nitrososphaerota archaeon]